MVVPFVGSGSECVAAIECSRRFIGTEINPAYVEIADARIANASAKFLHVGAESSEG